MPQVFVNKADLTNDPIFVVASFDTELPLVPRGQMGSGCTVLTLPATAITQVPDPRMPGTVGGLIPHNVSVLRSDWRTNIDEITNGEAYRRIIEGFTEFMQRNATNDNISSLQKYGNDTGTWPADAVARKAEADRGWAYIAAVRQASDAMQGSLPTDPTDDSHWPQRITPVYIEVAP